MSKVAGMKITTGWGGVILRGGGGDGDGSGGGGDKSDNSDM